MTDAELKRLKDAFKRSSTLNGYMTKQVFIREVLGDGVPVKLAEVGLDTVSLNCIDSSGKLFFYDSQEPCRQ